MQRKQEKEIHQVMIGAESEWLEQNWSGSIGKTRKMRAKTQKQKWLKKWGSEGKGKISIPKIGKQREAQGSRSKHLNYHVPGGHVACTAAIMHLIQNKTPRVVDSLRKPFIFYDCHDVS